MANKKKPTYSLPVRILALVMTGLVASGILVYLVLFIMQLLGL